MDGFTVRHPAENRRLSRQTLILQRVIGFLESAQIDGDLHVLFAAFTAGADVTFPKFGVAVHIDAQAALLGELSGEIDRETKLLMQAEGGFGGDASALRPGR